MLRCLIVLFFLVSFILEETNSFQINENLSVQLFPERIAFLKTKKAPPLSTTSIRSKSRLDLQLQMTKGNTNKENEKQKREEEKTNKKKPRVVVVGAGWAGFGAARHLAKEGYEVTLLDGAEDPGGAAAGIRTSKGNVVEAGIKGFWYQYKNIFHLLDELNLSNTVLTEWTGSSFWSKENGLEVDSPVFQNQELKLPTPLGQFIYTLPTFTNIPIVDRLSLWRLVLAMVDYQTDYEKYDSMSVADLMRENGVSDRFYKEFIRPLLLAMLFGPPEDLSAAVIIGSFYFLVLGSQENFDVRWCKGSISEKIFKPLLDDFKQTNNGIVHGGRFVSDIQMKNTTNSNGNSPIIQSVTAKDKNGKEYTYETDAVVFSIGINAMKKMIYQIPVLAEREEFRKILQLRCSDCIATRIWFNKRVKYSKIKNPSNVFSGFDNDIGSTFFDLNVLHDEYKKSNNNSTATSTCGSVIASDFYHASKMLPLTDEEIIDTVLNQLKTIDNGFKDQSLEVVDYSVIKAPQCATLFSPGSYRSRPKQLTSISNLYLCGDWVREEPMHGADGLSQERAYVTGLYAANLVIEKMKHGKKIRILQIDKDEPHIDVLKQTNSRIKEQIKNFPFPIPFYPDLPFF